DEECRPFFANLLPESEIRRAICRARRIPAHNDYKLLEALGGECAGAVSLWPEAGGPPPDPAYEPLESERLSGWLAGAQRSPLLIANPEARLSLAGAQQKLSVLVQGDSL